MALTNSNAIRFPARNQAAGKLPENCRKTAGALLQLSPRRSLRTSIRIPFDGARVESVGDLGDPCAVADVATAVAHPGPALHPRLGAGISQQSSAAPIGASCAGAVPALRVRTYSRVGKRYGLTGVNICILLAHSRCVEDTVQYLPSVTPLLDCRAGRPALLRCCRRSVPAPDSQAIRSDQRDRARSSNATLTRSWTGRSAVIA